MPLIYGSLSPQSAPQHHSRQQTGLAARRFGSRSQAGTRRGPNVGLMLAHRLRYWFNPK